ncbi:hypothetical protein J3R30DRAFT_2070848 [Lentinula aciculospora]|uniref:Uncharacterized protein n=1 Tax=Lentinula aciculospora TaxID=153920 RepID=A0A9W8ZWC0_9AGAR|nr:hypothetical protein J3R30DRAFT_2070848 [Lentinula aciculospora]
MKTWSLLTSIIRRLDDYQRIRTEEYSYELHSSNEEEDYGLPSPSHRRRKSVLHKRRFSLTVFSVVSYVQHTLTLRRLVFILTATLFLMVLGILASGVPSTYQDVRGYERSLPQHRIREAVNEKIGRDGVTERIHRRKYLWFDGALWGHGLNNVLQESFVMAYVAQQSHRSYVFEDHVWSQSPLPYTLYDFALRPSRIPMNAFISGPSAGGPFPDGSIARRAVSLEFFNTVCRPEERIVINTKEAPIDASLGKGADEIAAWFIDKLNKVEDDPCVVIDSAGRTLFDRELFGTKRILPIFSSLLESPILANFAWSPLVLSAVARNFAILQPDDLNDLYPSPPSYTHSNAGVLSGLVAVHLRRGDYSRHCHRLVGWDDEYMGVNQYEELPDRFDADAYLREHKFHSSVPPPPSSSTALSLRNSSSSTSSSSSSSLTTIPHRTSEEHTVLTPYYLTHCLPEIPEIVARLHQVRLDNLALKRVYLLSNGWGWWLNSLRDSLKKDGWEDVRHGGELEMDQAQKHVAMAVDMAIAEKAEVFVGNGFSSLSGNIVTLRLSKGFKPETNRFL